MFYLCRKQRDDGQDMYPFPIQQCLSIALLTKGQQSNTGGTCWRMRSDRPISPYEAPTYGPLSYSKTVTKWKACLNDKG